ncbi:hypothetical protein LP420_01375 [Massilia sp. B-10]|nr:hypothetical protein LP420_01375 [Massilia sp. B-10]
MTAGVANHGLLGSTVVRYGRMNIDNAYGSELLNLSMKLSAQYWNGLGWVTNDLDSCTPLLAANFTVTGQSGAPGITSTNMSMTNLSAVSNLAAGAGKVVLSKPVPAPTVKGSAKLNSTLPYLPGSGRDLRCFTSRDP